MKQIESYHIFKSEYGIVSLTINTKDKGLSWEIYLQGNYFVINIEDDFGKGESKEISKKELLLEDNEVQYVRFEQLNKDQMIYFWVPVRLIRGEDWFNKRVKNEN